MDWQNDTELLQLFRDELDERSGSLAEGAQAMLSGEIDSEIMGRMLREGHTIKGTGRVMGYEGIARGGEACEFVWRFIQKGDLEPSSMLARTLLMLAESIPEALNGDSSAVSESIETLRTLIDDPTLLEQLPQPLAMSNLEGHVAPEGATQDAGPVAEAVPETEDPTESPREVNEEDASAIASTVEAKDQVVADDPPVVKVDATTPDEPLVFEPGPNGILATPAITYEIVSEHTEPETMVETASATEPEAPAEARHTSTPESGSEPEGDGGSQSPAVTADDAPDVSMETTLGELPSLSVIDATPSVLDTETVTTYDLGGLVGAVETWATEESIPVNAGRLFRMINDVAAMRIDIDSAVEQATQVLSGGQRAASTAAAESVRESLEAVRRASVELEAAALGLTVVPISHITSTLPQLVRYLSKKLGREVVVVVEGEDTPIDRQLLDRVGEVMRQLVVNAVTHGLESSEDRVSAGKSSVGTVRVIATMDDQHLSISVSDDGTGIDWKTVREIAIRDELVGDDPTADDLRSALYADGFSTNPDSSEFAGSGSGLARVTEIVEEVFGSMTLESTAGSGTTFLITMPAHRALQRAQLFSAGERTWGIPDSVVMDVIPIPDVSISVTEKGSSIGYDNESVPYSSFAAVAGLEVGGLPSKVMVIQSPTGLIALAVDEVFDTHQVATKDLGPLLSGSSVVSGVALLGGDETVMLVDAGRLAERLRSAEVISVGPVHTVLIVDDSQGVRQVVSGVLASHGFSTVSAGSVSDALAALSKHDVDALVVDFSMPRADGVALVHMVRQRYGAIPIVMLSGVASAEDHSRAERAGVDVFFDKSDFARGALVQTLRDLIENGESNGEAAGDDSVVAV